MAQPFWAEIASNPYKGTSREKGVKLSDDLRLPIDRPEKFVNNKGRDRNQFIFVPPPGSSALRRRKAG
jgi:hypothetical protein